MKINRDEWTPLLQELQLKLNQDGRKKLLFEMIFELEAITISNFGVGGLYRPNEWKILNEDYAWKAHMGDRTPKLIKTGKLISSFFRVVGSENASLTNLCDYADEHLPLSLALNKHSGIPTRNYYPVNWDGTLTDYAQNRLFLVADDYFRTLGQVPF